MFIRISEISTRLWSVLLNDERFASDSGSVPRVLFSCLGVVSTSAVVRLRSDVGVFGVHRAPCTGMAKLQTPLLLYGVAPPR